MTSSLSLSAYADRASNGIKQPPTTAGWTGPPVCQFYMGSPVAKDPPSNGVLIFHPELPDALKKRSVPDRAQRVTHSIDRPLCQRGIPGHGRGGFGRRQRCRFLSFTPDALIARSPSARRSGLKIAGLLNVLIKRHSLRGVAGR